MIVLPNTLVLVASERLTPLQSPAVKQSIIETATAFARNRYLPYAEIAKLVDVTASASCLCCAVEIEDSHRRIAGVKSYLSSTAKTKRVQWAQNWCNWGVGEWATVIFSDEFAFNIGEVSGTVWVIRKPRKEYEQDCLVPKFAQRTTVRYGVNQKVCLLFEKLINEVQSIVIAISSRLLILYFIHGGFFFDRNVVIWDISIFTRMEYLHIRLKLLLTVCESLEWEIMFSHGLEEIRT